MTVPYHLMIFNAYLVDGSGNGEWLLEVSSSVDSTDWLSVSDLLCVTISVVDDTSEFC